MLVRSLKTISPWHRFAVISLLTAGISACTPGPERLDVVAEQGLLSGALSADGKLLLLGSVHHGGSLWSTSPAERLYDWNHASGSLSTLRAVGLSPPDAATPTAVTAEDKAISVWDLNTGQSKAFYGLPAVVESFDVSSDGRWALAGLRDSRALHIDLASGASRHEFVHGAIVNTVGMDQASQRAITGSEDQRARVWSLADGRMLSEFQHGNQVTAVALSADGSLAFSSAQREGSVIWDAASGDTVSLIQLGYERITSARFSDDRNTLLLGSFKGDVYRIEVASGQILQHWVAGQPSLFERNASRAVLSLAYLDGSDGQTIVAAVSNGTLQHFQLTAP
ncbi:hypothetical protein [Allohahella marinimesophila]|uniref:PQQ-binding-like beta-propeller repeat protein n=1 Tax=Allohahella marinimesophila TaxID=1054972 RepID=A0ABP7PC87_9GAMM